MFPPPDFFYPFIPALFHIFSPPPIPVPIPVPIRGYSLP